MAIEVVNIRAKVYFPDTELEIVTPYVQSFNINRKRGSMSDFNMSVKVSSDQINQVHGKIQIFAGVKDTFDSKPIYTGYVKKVVPSPVWKNPGYTMLNISGYDALEKIENKKYTRRQQFSDSSWAVITDVRDGLKTGSLKYASNEPKLIPTKEGLLEKPEKDTIDKQKDANSAPNSKEHPGVSIEATIGYNQ